MYLNKAGILAILAFSATTLANIYPDEDPCNPAPALDGEYQGEYDIRMDLDDARCSCEFPPPAPSEQRDEFDERNRIDSQQCGGQAPPEPWFDPGPLIDLGPIIVPVPIGGFGPSIPNWREPRGWRNPKWRPSPGRPGGRHFDKHAPRERGPRGQPFRPRGGNHEAPGRQGGGYNPGRPEPHREPPHPQPQPHRDPPKPSPPRYEPPHPNRPSPPNNHGPAPYNNNNNHGPGPANHGGRPGHP